MSKYTTEVRFIVETKAGLKGSVGASKINDILDKAIPEIFNFDFPIFDEDYRVLLERKILRHFYTREIGFETVGLWHLNLESKLNEIMPLYNQYYKSTLLEYNPLIDIDLYTKADTKFNSTASGDSNSTSKTEGTSSNKGTTTNSTTINNTDKTTSEGKVKNDGRSTDYDKYSDTPQGALTNVQNDRYLTNARMKTNEHSDTTTNDETVNSTGKVTNVGEGETHDEGGTSSNFNGNVTTSNQINNINDYLQHVSGKTSSRTYPQLIKEYRETFLNIDMMVINDLEELFFQLW